MGGMNQDLSEYNGLVSNGSSAKMVASRESPNIRNAALCPRCEGNAIAAATDCMKNPLAFACVGQKIRWNAHIVGPTVGDAFVLQLRENAAEFAAQMGGGSAKIAVIRDRASVENDSILGRHYAKPIAAFRQQKHQSADGSRRQRSARTAADDILYCRYLNDSGKGVRCRQTDLPRHSPGGQPTCP